MSSDYGFETCVIIGLGYIGLPTSVVVARSGIKVLGVDINPKTVEAVNAGRCPIEEPHLPAALAELVAKRRIRAHAEPKPGDVFIIAVPTPFTGGYKPDLSFVEAATRSIAPGLRRGNLHEGRSRVCWYCGRPRDKDDDAGCVRPIRASAGVVGLVAAVGFAGVVEERCQSHIVGHLRLRPEAANAEAQACGVCPIEPARAATAECRLPRRHAAAPA